MSVTARSIDVQVGGKRKTGAVDVMASPSMSDVRGFLSVGISAGLKRSGKPDLGILYSQHPCSAAGVFTKSRVPAAPVVLDRQILKKNSKSVRAIVVNSGHANAASGTAGMTLARRMVVCAEQSLNLPSSSVLVCSTGIIGDLPDERLICNGIAAASRQLSRDDRVFRRSILTTDKTEKISGVRLKLPDSPPAAIVGVAKGSGMIAPNMATMLAFIITDAEVPPALLKSALRSATEESFNSVSVDGDTSTNDTVLVMANGTSGARIPPKMSSASAQIFAAGLSEVCKELAWQIVEDGEGATKVIEVTVRGARTAASAKKAARTVAESLLVKTAMHGGDPNVGRVLAALGRSDVPEICADRIDVYFNGVRGVVGGILDRSTPALALRNALRPRVIQIYIDLGSGRAAGRFVSCDMSAEYVRINSEYRT